MAAQRREFSRAAVAGPGAGEARVAGGGRIERAAEDGVPVAFRGRNGHCRNRAGDRIERGYGEGAPLARFRESARRGEGESMSIDERLEEGGEGEDRVSPFAGLVSGEGVRNPEGDPVMEQALRDFRLSVHAWSDAAYQRPR